MIATGVIVGATAYVTWGIIHHWRRGDLHLKVVLEYIGIAILGVALALSVIRNR